MTCCSSLDSEFELLDGITPLTIDDLVFSPNYNRFNQDDQRWDWCLFVWTKMIHDQSESTILQKNANRIQGQKAQKQRKIIQPQKRQKKFCHQYQLSARRWTKWTLTPRQAVASFLLFRISLAGDVIVVMNSHLTSGIVERDWSAIKC